MGHQGRPAFWIATAAATVSLLVLASLHVLSPEFDPSWRMISEYANGRHRWVLSLMFATWALGSWALAYALYSDLTTWWGKAGFGLLVVSGIGEAMAVPFDVNHPLHGLAFLFGVGGFLVASTIISARLATTDGWRVERRILLWSAVLNWVAVLVMAIAMTAFIRSLKDAGVEVGPGRPPLAALPEGMSPFNGWANRFLVLVFQGWLLIVASRGRKVHSTVDAYDV